MSEMHEYVGWRTLFAIPPALVLLSFTSFLMRSSRHVKISTSSSGSRNNIGTVIIATWRRRWLLVLESGEYHARWSHSKQSMFVRPTDRLSTIATTPGALPNYQAQVMDCHIGCLNLTPASYIVFNVGTMTLWMILYALLTSTRLRNGIPPRIRMATSLIVSCLANLPEEMKSVGNALVSSRQCFGMLAAAMVMGQVRRHTGWVKDDLNCGRIDYYY
ncbi:hypothetical protein LINPERHAP1_LOCUS34734, partial [Linum perenne]